MKSKIAFLLLIIFTGMFSACTQTSPEVISTPSLEIINLQIIPELKHLTPRISQCAESISDTGIYTDFLTQENLNINQTDLILRLGQREKNDPYVSVMGTEEIVVIVGREVAIETLGIESLQAIFSDVLKNWGDVPEFIQQQSDVDQPIQTLSYPEGNILRHLFNNTFLEGDPIDSEPLLYATPGGITQLIEDNPYGIGYLLKSQVTENQKLLTITGSDTLSSEQYVLAITSEEPEGKLKQFLLCLQNSQ